MASTVTGAFGSSAEELRQPRLHLVDVILEVGDDLLLALRMHFGSLLIAARKAARSL